MSLEIDLNQSYELNKLSSEFDVVTEKLTKLIDDNVVSDHRDQRRLLDLTNWAANSFSTDYATTGLTGLSTTGSSYLIGLVNRKQFAEFLAKRFIITDMSSAFEGLPITVNPVTEAIGNDASYAFANTKLIEFEEINLPYATVAKGMFENAKELVGILVDVNMPMLKDVEGMFKNCLKLTNLGGVSFPAVTNASEMFMNCQSLTQVGDLGMTEVTNTTRMFKDCSALTNVVKIDLSNVTDASEMFMNCRSLTHIGDLGTTEVTNTARMFKDCSALTNIVKIDLSNVTDATEMFAGCTMLSSLPFQLDLTSITDVEKLRNILNNTRVSTVRLRLSDELAAGFNSKVLAEISRIKTIDIENVSGEVSTLTLVYPLNASKWWANGAKIGKNNYLNATSADDLDYLSCMTITVCNEMFKGAVNVRSVPDLTFTDASALSLLSMFEGCTSLTTIPKFTIPNVSTAEKMFKDCTALTSVPDDFTLAGNKNISLLSMFEGCTSLTTAPKLTISKVSTAEKMFKDCTALTSVSDGFTLTGDNNISLLSMFEGCTSLTTAPKLMIPKISTAKWMFKDCTSLTSLRGFRLPLNYTSAYGLFEGCVNLEEITDCEIGMGSYSDANVFKGCTKVTSITNSTLGVRLDDLTSLTELNATVCGNLGAPPALRTATLRVHNSSATIEGAPLLESINVTITDEDGSFDISDCPELTSVVMNIKTDYQKRIGRLNGNPKLTHVEFTGITSNHVFDPATFSFPEDEGPYACVLRLYEMFADDTSLESINLDMSKIAYPMSLDETFRGCTLLRTAPKIGVPFSMYKAFEDCSSLPETFPWVIDLRIAITYNNEGDGRYVWGDVFKGSSVQRATVRIPNGMSVPVTLKARILDLDELTVINADGDVVEVSDRNTVPSIVESYQYDDTFTVPDGVTKIRVICVSGSTINANLTLVNDDYVFAQSDGIVVNKSFISDANDNVLIESLGNDAPDAAFVELAKNATFVNESGYTFDGINYTFATDYQGDYGYFYGAGAIIEMYGKYGVYRGYVSPGRTLVEQTFNVTPGDVLNIHCGPGERNGWSIMYDYTHAINGYVLIAYGEEYVN